jgi:hypothetical protein
MIIEIIVFFMLSFIIFGNYTSVIIENDIRTTRRFNGLLWMWLLREKMFWKRVEDLKPNSRKDKIDNHE